ncbi:MAG: hypothetical protein AB8H47_27840 [Bacteroidia bacterium]
MIGYFFSSHERFVGKSMMQQFTYRPIHSKTVEIFVVFRADSIEFYLSANPECTSTRLFFLKLTDPLHPQSKLVRQLYNLRYFSPYKVTIPEDERERFASFEDDSIFNFSNIKRHLDTNKNIFDTDIPLAQNQYFPEKGEIHLCASSLLLDFLFDLEYSEVFSQSPYYQQVVNFVYNNPLFKSILAKAAAYHKASIFEKMENKLTWADAIKAVEAWVEISRDPNNSSWIETSPWFSTLAIERDDPMIFMGKLHKRQEEFRLPDSPLQAMRIKRFEQALAKNTLHKDPPE